MTGRERKGFANFLTSSLFIIVVSGSNCGWPGVVMVSIFVIWYSEVSSPFNWPLMIDTAEIACSAAGFSLSLQADKKANKKIGTNK